LLQPSFVSTRKYAAWSTGLSLGGTVFAAYLSWTRWTSGVCAFEEPCPFFLGHPACYTGFLLFAACLAVSAAALVFRAESAWPMAGNTLLSALGVLFAGRMSLLELVSGQRYRLGLPTCAWGLAFFVVLLVLSLTALIRAEQHRWGRPLKSP
jgi:hypothetical protein